MNNNQKYNIIKNRIEIYRDFALNLLYCIFDYYLDKETLNKDQDIKNHFNWCFKKVCNEFLKEEINFSDNDELNKYFFTYYYHQFYTNNQEISIKYFEKFWKNIFDMDRLKNKNKINILIEIYNIYDKSINSEKNILEIV